MNSCKSPNIKSLMDNGGRMSNTIKEGANTSSFLFYCDLYTEPLKSFILGRVSGQGGADFYLAL